MSFKRIEHAELFHSELGKRVDLASSALGSTIVAVTDEFFGPARNLIQPAPPKHCLGRYVATGVWVDGWQTRRHNTDKDSCIIKLGFAGVIRGIDIDTQHFSESEVPLAAVEAAYCPDGDVQAKEVEWTEILPKVDLQPNNHNVFMLANDTRVYTHVRLHNIPDGGIARFRVYGNVHSVWPDDLSTVVDLASVSNGGQVLHATDAHYGPATNLLLPGRGENADDGWQTRRTRSPGHSDHVIIRLGHPGHILQAELDTHHFKGNYPASIQLEAAHVSEREDWKTAAWVTLVEQSRVGPHGVFFFDAAHTDQVFTHAKISIFPDGGFQRLRLRGIRQGGSVPPLPLPRKVWMTAEPLSPENYAAYGDVIETNKDGCKMTGANQGTAEKFHHVAQVTNAFPKKNGNFNMCIFHCRPATELPFEVKLLERHPYSSQAFVPMAGTEARNYLVVVALNGPGDKPDMATLKAFVATTQQGINYHPGVWHHPMIALEHETDFICFVHESGVPDDDCNEVNVPSVHLNVPGFQ